MDALATPYKVLKRARIEPGESVAIFGAGGGLGIHQVMMAKWANARVIAVDTRADKFNACREAGADEVVDASKGNVVEALMDLTRGKEGGYLCRLRVRQGHVGSGSPGPGQTWPLRYPRWCRR